MDFEPEFFDSDIKLNFKVYLLYQAVLSLEDQLKQFKEYIEKLKGMVGEERTRYILENSVFLVVAGSDDLANTYFTIGIRRLQYDIPSYADLLISSASNFIQVYCLVSVK